MSIAEIAQAAGLRPTTLHQRFQRFLGQTPLETLTHRRVRAASALLVQEPALGVAEVGRRCGFRDAVHFGRVFRARQGVSPGAFRRRHAAAGLPVVSG
jgi:AraC-like DNA-binding protein